MASIIEQWGYDPADKVVILHLDDMAITHSCNVAVKEIFEKRITSTGSIIAPANWVPEMIQMLKNLPPQDIGVHLTLTSEHKNLRWIPLSNPAPASSLVDQSGYMWPTINDAVDNVSIEDAEREIEAQILHLQKNGIDLTHLDAHMFSVNHPKFLPTLIKISAKYNIPAFIPEITEFMFKYMGFLEASAPYHRQLDLLREQGYPLVDDIKFASLEKVKNKLKVYRKIIESIKPGLTHLLFHPGIYNDELEAITTGSEIGRFQDYEVLMNHKFGKILEENNIQIGTYGRMREHWQKISHKFQWTDFIQD
ncbi:MAG: polysaccharide deacetylase family protein [Promethearchaeota archaeon]